MEKKIVQKEDPVLRLKAGPVKEEEIASPEIRGVLRTMKSVLLKEEDGVAIAAPQIKESLRIFVVSGKIFKKEGDTFMPPDLIFINPEIVSRSKETELLEEGCLSVRGIYGRVKHSKEVTLSFLDEGGVRRSTTAHGLLAQIFEHEVDHLDGILFIDKAEIFERVKSPNEK